MIILINKNIISYLINIRYILLISRVLPSYKTQIISKIYKNFSKKKKKMKNR